MAGASGPPNGGLEPPERPTQTPTSMSSDTPSDATSTLPASSRVRRYFRQARAVRSGNDLVALKWLAERCVAAAPEEADGWRMLAEAHAQPGLEAEGLERIREGLEHHPDDLQLRLQRCGLNLRLNRRAACRAEVDELLLRDELDLNALRQLAGLLALLDDMADSVPLHERICELAPDDPQHWLSLSMAERAAGRLDSARAHVAAVLEQEQPPPRAYWLMSSLRRARPEDHMVMRLRAALESDWLAPMQKVYLAYALVSECEDLGDWEGALAAARLAGELHSGLRPWDEAVARAQVEAVLACQGEALLDGFRSLRAADEPIFIVGMPRSGTTLIEQILGSHERVFPAGELRQFPQALGLALGPMEGLALSPEQMPRLGQLDFERLAADYLASTRPRCGHTAHFTDKLPMNFLHLGLIARAFPGARFIHVTRHPLAVCWSNFKILFGDGHEWSYRLEDIAQFYLLYRRLMSHWIALMPDRIHRVHYEDLVADPEAITRGLLDHCGLPWQADCLDFHRASEPVITASAVQVRQPLYDVAVDQWRNYARELEPARQSLLAAGIQVD